MGRESGATYSIKKEQQETLERKNTVRAFLSAAVSAVLIPVFVLIIHIAGLYGGLSARLTVCMAFCEAAQLFLAVRIFFIITRNEVDRRNPYSVAEFFTAAVCMMIASGFDRTVYRSPLFCIILAAYVVLVPVMEPKLRRIYCASAVAGSIIAAAVSHPDARNMFDTVLCGVLMFWACETVHNSAFEHIRTQISLLDKTVTADRDALTGLLNRRGLDKNVTVLWPYCVRTSSYVGVIEIDVDFFKKYNDRFGNPAGDRCLKLIAKTIKHCAAGCSDVVARTGGEEFLVFVQGMNEEELVDFAMKIRSSINGLKIPHAYAEASSYLTVSIGIACEIPDEAGSIDGLYATADNALYTAKEKGRNCVVSGDRIYGRMKKGLATVISI